MTKSSYMLTGDIPVKASSNITLIKVDMMIKYSGSPGDFITMHEDFFDALDGKSPCICIFYEELIECIN